MNTPRTNAHAVKWGSHKEGEFVDAEICREIERELQDANEWRDSLRKALIRATQTPRPDGCAKDARAHAEWMQAQEERFLRFDAQDRERAAILSWDEERKRAIREGNRVLRANELLREAFSHVRNMPLASDIAIYMSQFDGEGQTPVIPDDREEAKNDFYKQGA